MQGLGTLAPHLDQCDPNHCHGLPGVRGYKEDSGCDLGAQLSAPTDGCTPHVTSPLGTQTLRWDWSVEVLTFLPRGLSELQRGGT